MHAALQIFFVLFISRESLFTFICVPDQSFWVSDSRQPFVERASKSLNVLYMKVKEPLVIPCRVTDPNITTTLVKVSTGSQHPSSTNTSVFLSAECVYSLTPRFVFLCSITALSSVNIITFPSKRFHLILHMHAHTEPSPVASPGPDRSPHCSGLGSHGAVVCVHLFVSFCGYVWKCVRMCLWVLALECWVRPKAFSRFAFLLCVFHFGARFFTFD